MAVGALEMREPIINTYTSYGCLFSIMDDQLWPWIYNNFIQIRYARGWGIFAFDNHHLLLKNCPGVLFYSLPQEMFKTSSLNSLKSYVIDAIDMGYYLFIYVDRYYISKSNSYNKEHFVHEMLIYGYDIDSNTVMIADNLLNGKFIRTSCSFDELENGYWSINAEYDFWTEVRYLKRNTNYKCDINLEKIALNIEDYIFSRKTFDLVEEQECDFGMKAIHRLLSNIENVEKIDTHLDIRPFHLFYEHKILMEMRIKYLMRNNYINTDNCMLEEVKKLKDDYSLLRNRVLKYNLKKDSELLLRIHGELNKNLIMEQKLLLELLYKINVNSMKNPAPSK